MNNVLEIKCLRPGLYDSIQDLGREGNAQWGVPTGGAMDQSSAQLANLLVGNNPSGPTLEITGRGPAILFKSDAIFALCGANISAHSNEQKLSMNVAIRIRAGRILSLENIIGHGYRTYLAIAGDWKITKWLNSTSPLVFGKEGVLQENVLKKGSKILISTQSPEILPEICIPQKTKSPKIPFYKGPEWELLSISSQKEFLEKNFTVASTSNRMAYRFVESLKTHKSLSEMLSAAVLPGTIQLNHKGEPMALMRDAQTIGGYPRMGILPERSINLLAQKKPHEKVQFELISYGF